MGKGHEDSTQKKKKPHKRPTDIKTFLTSLIIIKEIY